MLRQWKTCLLVFVLYAGTATAQAGRGELLYSTYCNACHAEQVHWREKRLVTDWSSLIAEVDRWQANGNLGWSSDDSEMVARYLNAAHYHFPPPEK